MTRSEIKAFLDEKAEQYERPDFIPHDPIQVVHEFSRKQDVEIVGFLTATIAWGQRITIINNARKICELMDQSPHEFVLNHSDSDLKMLQRFKHRTLNGDDLVVILNGLKSIYSKYDSMALAFDGNDTKARIVQFRNELLNHIPSNFRTHKHVSDPSKGSAAKRLNMFLRWMVRDSRKGVDFGLWKNIPKSELVLPLDVHTGKVARKLGLLKRKVSDWKAAEEVSAELRHFDPVDPVKYDFALFGLGAFEKF
jgi:uncharacterized protein (TIGR02757 family)